ncbi:hydrophobic/amphiphilic exporter-1, HAE1 family [Mucilaginibacter lappiensis]|uniref:HAE1 family hydrophobic/amphiphilic exporter-1 n=1 Tax=Mucilaginibacter lappiensis TaxID=354630 RepID=A0ABR6PFR8_9SPHI|nr:efflux RND transporter permease subunit [Mucilaginibacter lappiensis]MBB6108610.1 HAE1 family hydrophobic/amphiphilic exporter-1 [Mucilaginibacter lappiensis]SIQ30866.1 hydrophobic/amphiphilic exporter-1, HAE1 family [Mucilaginibacter lappiensis]
MLKVFIDKPVIATVVSIMLVILGAVGLMGLPIQQFPDIAPPVVQVSANYPGANAETMVRAVAPPLEEAINGVENMTYMSSTSSNDGTLTISVYFKLGTDPDQAAVNVQNRVSSATGLLPPEVVQAGITTQKVQNSLIMAINLMSDKPKLYDATYLTNYAQINIIPELKRIQGVGQVTFFGSNKDYSMRIWLNPSQMAAYNITPTEVMTAVKSKNQEAAPGRFGESSNRSFEYVLKYPGKYTKPEEYGNMIIRANPDGSMLKLKDVAKVELGSYTYSSLNTVNDKQSVLFQVIQLPGTNSREIQTKVAEFLKKAEKDFPPGIKQQILYNTKDMLDQSIDQVEHTLLEAFVLVFMVVYLFLQDFRSTLIPAIAVPVALIGTFFFMSVFGFSINLLTLFALVLAIGIVVDDAIVVVEAVHSKLEHRNMSPKKATMSAMHEITGAIISITLVMAAVFLPVGFMKGSAGVFYRQFAFTLAIAISISALNALTLSPALCALLLKDVNHDHHEKPKTFKQRFFFGFNKGFEHVTGKYVGAVKKMIQFKWVSMAGLVLVVLITGWLIRITPTGFIPSEDLGFIAISVNLPPGSSMNRTQAILDEAANKVRDMKAKFAFNEVAGFNVLTSSTSPSSGVAFFRMRKDGERGEMNNVGANIAELQKRLNTIKGAQCFVFSFPTVPGFSNVDALDFVLEDKAGGKLDKFGGLANRFIAELMKRKEIAVAFTTFRADYPQYEMVLDHEKIEQLEVDEKDVLSTMQSYFGSAQVSDFNRFGKYYRVMVQAEQEERADPASMNQIYVKNKTGNMVPVNTMIRLKRVYGPEAITRYNLFNSIGVNAVPKPGYSTGSAIQAVREVAANVLPAGYSFEFSGMTREEISSGGQSVIIFVLSLLFVYFLLCAQYNSYILPLAVVLSVPTGIIGVFVAIGLTGIDNNIYIQVALIMLIGLLAKNAILIVEFAVQRRHAGHTLVESALEAAKLRIRPIIMTSIAFVAGISPMMRATGPSAMGNHSISIGAAGGMLGGVVLGLFIIPVLFVVFQAMHEKVTGKKVHSEPNPGLVLEAEAVN